MGEALNILGLERGASADDAKRAYRQAVMRCHPDRNATEAARLEFIDVSQAYAKISGKGKPGVGGGGATGDTADDIAWVASATADLAWATAFAGREIMSEVGVPLAKEVIAPLAKARPRRGRC